MRTRFNVRGDVAGKTGTTQNNTDGWFILMHPRLVAGSWVGFNDPRVSYWEPAKWVARLRTLKTDGNLLLLKTTIDAGHGGTSGRYAALKEVAFEYAFVLKALGVAGQP